MRYSLRKIITVNIILLFCLIIINPIFSCEYNSNKIRPFNLININDKEIDLLRVEHYLYLDAYDNTDIFNVKYAFPPDYQYQTPVLLEILEDSTASIISYKIEDCLNNPNKIVNFTIAPMNIGERVLIHFICWVIVKNHTFNDMPYYTKIPSKYDLPEDTLIWLSSSEVVQSKSLIIRYRANQLRGNGDNLINFAKNISIFIKEHRSILFFIQYKLGIFFSQDAKTTLFIGGENIGRSHLACALLRSNNIPSRVLLVNNDQGFWTQMHYMIEYYCPGYGWILMDSTEGKTPYDTKRQVINRICYPEDEDDTKVDYIFPLMKGEERWIWIDSENVFPYYVDCNEGSKSQMFTESEIINDWFTIDYSFFRTKTVFNQYEKYLSIELSVENQEYLDNAIFYQRKAVYELAENDDLFEYIYYLDKSYDEYKKIILD
jgi:hypothetical protein